MSTNFVTLFGNLTRDAEAIPTNGKAMTRMRVATNARWTDADGIKRESVEFHSVVAFGELAELAAAECRKGRRVYVDGRLRTREYDGSDGVRRSATEIVAQSLRFFSNSGRGSRAAQAATVEAAS